MLISIPQIATKLVAEVTLKKLQELACSMDRLENIKMITSANLNSLSACYSEIEKLVQYLFKTAQTLTPQNQVSLLNNIRSILSETRRLESEYAKKVGGEK